MSRPSNWLRSPREAPIDSWNERAGVLQVLTRISLRRLADRPRVLISTIVAALFGGIWFWWLPTVAQSIPYDGVAAAALTTIMPTYATQGGFNASIHGWLRGSPISRQVLATWDAARAMPKLLNPALFASAGFYIMADEHRLLWAVCGGLSSLWLQSAWLTFRVWGRAKVGRIPWSDRSGSLVALIGGAVAGAFLPEYGLQGAWPAVVMLVGSVAVSRVLVHAAAKRETPNGTSRPNRLLYWLFLFVAATLPAYALDYVPYSPLAGRGPEYAARLNLVILAVMLPILTSVLSGPEAFMDYREVGWVLGQPRPVWRIQWDRTLRIMQHTVPATLFGISLGYVPVLWGNYDPVAWVSAVWLALSGVMTCGVFALLFLTPPTRPGDPPPMMTRLGGQSLLTVLSIPGSTLVAMSSMAPQEQQIWIALSGFVIHVLAMSAVAGPLAYLRLFRLSYLPLHDG